MNKENVPVLPGTQERAYGLDLLKIVTMMFICILHVCNKGGITSQISLSTYPDNYRLVVFLKALTYGSVNIYSMISGYVGYNKKFKLSRPVMIWLELIFYTLSCTLLLSFIRPDLLPEGAWFKSIMPVMNREYWYMTAYFGMVVLMPFLNVIIQKSSMKTMSFVLLGVLVFYCTIPTIMDVSVFNLGSGYSTLWLCVMYITGGYLARIKKKPHPLISFALFILMVLLTWFLRLKDVSAILNYTSHTVVIGAAALVMTFAQIKINKKFLQKSVTFVANSTLGIFILHVHTLIWDTILPNCAKAYAKSNVFFLALMIIVLAAAIFVGCGIVDVLRRGLFWLLHIKPLLQKADKLLEKLFAGKEKEKAEEDVTENKKET